MILSQESIIIVKVWIPHTKKSTNRSRRSDFEMVNEDEIERQGELLASLNLSCPNNAEQQNAYNNIMNSIDEFRNTDQDLLTSHQFHFIGGPGKWGNLHCLESYTLHVAARVC
jgi:hypothetical protein